MGVVVSGFIAVLYALIHTLKTCITLTVIVALALLLSNPITTYLNGTTLSFSARTLETLMIKRIHLWKNKPIQLITTFDSGTSEREYAYLITALMSRIFAKNVASYYILSDVPVPKPVPRTFVPSL